MQFNSLLSPGVQVREIDQSEFIRADADAGAGTVGQFVWGPVEESVQISSSTQLQKMFGRPNDTNFIDWFSANNFLAYSNNLRLVRVCNNNARNASVDGTGRLVKNQSHLNYLINVGEGGTDLFIARYPGALGNSLRVSMADANTFDDWEYKAFFAFQKPGTSKYSRDRLAANDEVHVVVVDERGRFNGIPGQVLEKYSYLSKAYDAKDINNQPNFYGNVINSKSQYLFYMSPLVGSTVLDLDSYISSVTLGDGGTNYGKPIVTVYDYDPDSESPIVGSGTGAVIQATKSTLGVITGLRIVNAGNGYTTPVFVKITDSGSGASATPTVEAGVITAIEPLTRGAAYYTANVTITDQGAGAAGTAVLAATGTTKTVTLNAAGTGYTVGDVLTIGAGTSTFTVTAITGGSGTGPIDTGTVSHGTGYAATATGVTSTGGTGTNATFDITVGKAVASVTMTNTGHDYGNANVTFTSATGTGAAGTAVIGEDSNLGKIMSVTITAGGSGYETAPTVAFAPRGTGATATAVLGELNTNEEGEIIGYIVTNGGTDYGNPLVTVTPGGSGATATAVVTANDEADTNWGLPTFRTDGKPRTYYSLKEPYEKTLGGGSDGSLATISNFINGWNLFKNAEAVNVGLLYVGNGGSDASTATVVRHIIDNICEVRRDCMVFFSPRLMDVLGQTQANATRLVKSFVTASVNRDTSFAVADTGWKLQFDNFNNKARWIPLNADIAGICAQTETKYDSWWSPAGSTRGKLKNVMSLAFNPNQLSRDELYKANINSVVTFTGQGTFLYGDRTLQTKDSAFSFINVRRLFIALEQTISESAKNQLFEFNDMFTRTRFVGTIEPYLRSIHARRGIYDYKVVCDETNNTPDVIDRAEFVASIYIKPARSINYITLNFIAVGAGVEFSEVVGAV